MISTSTEVRTETVHAPIEWVGTSCGSKSVRVTVNGESLTLKVPKGTRGVKVGATLAVRIEWRDWYSMTRTTFHMREGTSETVAERHAYHDGQEHAHYYFDGIAYVMTNHPYMTYRTDDGTDLEFRWHGGEYVDIGYTQAQGEPGIHGDDFHAYDVINVWDHAKGEPRIPRTLDAFAARCEEWIADHAEEERSTY